jgi:hypothetical protein
VAELGLTKGNPAINASSAPAWRGWRTRLNVARVSTSFTRARNRLRSTGPCLRLCRTSGNSDSNALRDEERDLLVAAAGLCGACSFGSRLELQSAGTPSRLAAP